MLPRVAFTASFTAPIRLKLVFIYSWYTAYQIVFCLLNVGTSGSMRAKSVYMLLPRWLQCCSCSAGVCGPSSNLHAHVFSVGVNFIALLVFSFHHPYPLTCAKYGDFLDIVADLSVSNVVIINNIFKCTSITNSVIVNAAYACHI